MVHCDTADAPIVEHGYGTRRFVTVMESEAVTASVAMWSRPPRPR